MSENLHYKCSFSIVSDKNSEFIWNKVTRIVRKWIQEKNSGIDSSEFKARWFFTGGRWVDPNIQRKKVTTYREVGKFGENSPQFWSLRFEHPDDVHTFRQWRTDIGLEIKNEHEIVFSLANYYRIESYYIGQEPPTPIPSLPRVVKKIISENEIKVFSGTEQHSVHIKKIEIGDGKYLLDRIEDKNRKCPIIYISLNRETDTYAVNLEKIKSTLIGTATIYAAGHTKVDEEMFHLFRKEYLCTNGKVRIYLPDLNYDHENDYRRHRFFTYEYIKKEIGEEDFIRMLANNLAKRAKIQNENAVVSIEDVERKSKLIRLEKLRLESKENIQWINLLEEENEQLKRENNILKQENTNLKIKELEYLEKIEDIEKSKNLIESSKNEIEKQFTPIKEENATLKNQISYVRNIKKTSKQFN